MDPLTRYEVAVDDLNEHRNTQSARAERKICGHLKPEMGNVLDKVRNGAEYVHRRYEFLT